MSEFKYPKILNLIWDSSKLTFLNYITVLSFKKFHPDWSIHVYYTTQKSSQTWKTQEQKEIIADEVENYWSHLFAKEYVKMICVDEFSNTVGLKHLSTIQQSDILRIYILYNYGGVYSDFDIIYTCNIEPFFKDYNKNILFYGVEPSGYTYFPVGVFIANPKEDTYQKILQIQIEESKKTEVIEDYQYFGAAMFKRLKLTHPEIFDNFHLVSSKCYLPITWFEVEKKLYKNLITPPNSFGVHWFNGSIHSRKYINSFNISNYNPCNSTIDSLIEPYISEIFNNKPIQTSPTTRSILPKISIVMSYINRKRQLEHTLKTISQSSHKNLEIVIVDDGSLEEHRIEDLIKKFDMDIILIRIDPNDKEWINPCVPYNIALDRCTGEIIVLQNPEVCHVGDILKYCRENIDDKTYLTFSVVSSPNEIENNKIYNHQGAITSSTINDVFTPQSWYNHPTARNSQFHFLSAMTRSTLDRVGGFNEDFRYGISYDDDEFIGRMRKTANCITLPPDVGFGIHLWHTGGSLFYDKEVDLLKTLINLNRRLNGKLENSDTIRLNRTSHTLYKSTFNKNVIIIGSTGMLGSYVKKFLQDKVNLVVVDRNLLDVENIGSSMDLEAILKSRMCYNSVIINCCGKIPQNNDTKLVKGFIQVNTLFPKYLSDFVENYNTANSANSKLIHITTDCVFSGSRGSYTESDIPDEIGIYGITKYMGENNRDTIIRTSIIGEEKNNKKSLLEWVKSNKEGEIRGYTKHYWNGVTCLELSKIIYRIISEGIFWKGVRHVYSPDKVSKHRLISFINNLWDLKIKIKEEGSRVVDKSLKTNYSTDLNPIVDIETQLIALREYAL